MTDAPRTQKYETLACLFILAVVACWVLALQPKIAGFQKGHHGFLSSHGAALAANLSVHNYLLMFTSVEIDDKGENRYVVYNRFPLIPFLLIKLSMSLGHASLTTQIYAARQLMNVFWLAALILAFLIGRIFLEDAIAALGASLLSFSSKLTLYYHDMIFNDIPAFFGFLLVTWCVLLYKRGSVTWKGLLWAAVVSLSMGWQPLR